MATQKIRLKDKDGNILHPEVDNLSICIGISYDATNHEYIVDESLTLDKLATYHTLYEQGTPMYFTRSASSKSGTTHQSKFEMIPVVYFFKKYTSIPSFDDTTDTTGSSSYSLVASSLYLTLKAVSTDSTPCLEFVEVNTYNSICFNVSKSSDTYTITSVLINGESLDIDLTERSTDSSAKSTILVLYDYYCNGIPTYIKYNNSTLPISYFKVTESETIIRSIVSPKLLPVYISVRCILQTTDNTWNKTISLSSEYEIDGIEMFLGDDTVYTNTIRSKAVTTEKLADSCITSDKILDNSVTSNKITAQSITSDKLKNITVTDIQDSTGYVYGSCVYGSMDIQLSTLRQLKNITKDNTEVTLIPGSYCSLYTCTDSSLESSTSYQPPTSNTTLGDGYGGWYLEHPVTIKLNIFTNFSKELLSDNINDSCIGGGLMRDIINTYPAGLPDYTINFITNSSLNITFKDQIYFRGSNWQQAEGGVITLNANKEYCIKILYTGFKYVGTIEEYSIGDGDSNGTAYQKIKFISNTHTSVNVISDISNIMVNKTAISDSIDDDGLLYVKKSNGIMSDLQYTYKEEDYTANLGAGYNTILVKIDPVPDTVSFILEESKDNVTLTTDTTLYTILPITDPYGCEVNATSYEIQNSDTFNNGLSISGRTLTWDPSIIKATGKSTADIIITYTVADRDTVNTYTLTVNFEY